MSRLATSHAPAVAELEAEIARTRSRLSQSLAAIDREYALRHLLVHGARAILDKGARPSLSPEQLRREVVSSAFIGAGLLWSILGDKEGWSLLRRVADGFAQMRNMARDLLAASAPGRSSAASGQAMIQINDGLGEKQEYF